MAYDEALADRIRDLLADVPDLTERKMFGGLAFLVGGHMAVTASGRGGLMVRCDPAAASKLVAAGQAEPMVMKGRAMTGWLRVDGDAIRTARALRPWVDRGVATARAQPPR